MCGIIGCTGIDNCSRVLIEGLTALEYRGYDSAGIAIDDGEQIVVRKTVGSVENLVNSIGDLSDLTGNCGIAHSRWATHGKPSYHNAHPHLTKRFALVHNGIIENADELKNKYLSGYKLLGDTDSEVIANIMQYFIDCGEEPERALRRLIAEMKGSYAIIIIDKMHSGTLYALKNRSPLLIGIGMSYNLAGSDVLAMAKYTNIFCELYDLEYAVINKNEVNIYNSVGETVPRESFISKINAHDAQKGTYHHYMLKEIEEQPAVIRRIMQHYIIGASNFRLDSSMIECLRKSKKIYIIGCGTSYNAGLIGAWYFEKLSGKRATAHVASEFVCNMPLIEDNAAFIFISQSGETADCKAALDMLKKKKCTTIAITNNDISYISRSCDYQLSLLAGVEIAVASTKAYTAEIVLMMIMSAAISDKFGYNMQYELNRTIDAIEQICSKKFIYKNISEKYIANSAMCFYIGKGVDYYTSLEAALKLREISYIPTFGISSGELKHGSIALISDEIPVISVITDTENASMALNAVNEVATRGAHTICISGSYTKSAMESIVLGDISSPFLPIVSVIPAQYIAYFAALYKGCDVDKPRNLAKSVTVE